MRRQPTTVASSVAPGMAPDGADPPSPRRLRHLPGLDGLRGVAVVGVLAFHAGHLTGGYLGVDLFFVLSGYLITSLLVLEWSGTGTVVLSRFWARRARRLLPALFAVLAVVGVVAHWQVAPEARGSLRDEGFATLGYVANWFAVVKDNGYWEQALLPSWLQHTWSLAIEEQFYLLWPLVVGLVFGAWRRSRGPVGADPAAVRRSVRRLGLVAWGGAAASAGLMIVWGLAGGSQERLYLGTDTRVAAILLGAGLACRQFLAGHTVAEADPAVRPSDRRWVVGVAGVVAALFLAVAWSRLGGTSELLYRGGLLACGIAAAVVLLDVTTPGRSAVRPVLELPPLRWLGWISYGLYLWHWPIYQYLVPGRFGLRGAALVAVRIGASLAVAVVSYVVLEQPIRRGALQGRAVRLAVPATAVAVAVALLVGTTGAIDPPSPAAAEQAGVYQGTDPDAPRVMVLGDSVAFALAVDGLGPLADELGVRVVNRAKIGCTIMRDVDDPFNEAIRNCSPDWPAYVQEDRPDVVVVLFGGFVGVLPATVDGREVWPCDAEYDALWSRRLDEAVGVLSAGGAKVVLLSAPGAPIEVFKGENPTQFDARQRCSNDVLEAVATTNPDAAFVDLAGFVCPDDECRVAIDGLTLRNDGVHYRGDAAKLVARWAVPEVLEAAGTG